MDRKTANEELRKKFPVGFYDFSKYPGMNFQLNLYHSFGIFTRAELEDIGRRADSFEKWISVFIKLGRKAEENGETLKAATCFIAAQFYTLSDDSDKRGRNKKRLLYERSRRLYDEYYGSIPELKYVRIPFENYRLPVYFSTVDNAKGTIVIHGGYDSFIQEFLGLYSYFRALGYNVYFFEGPGQGEVLMRYNVRMTHEWEHCTSAVLDYFGLNDVTLMGVSLGGYLATRAAAYDKRISRLVMYDLIYDFYGSIIGKMGKKGKFFDYMVSHPKNPLWVSLNRKLNADYFTKWLLGQGYRIFENVHTPCEYFEHIKLYNTREISKLVTQDTLVLAGTSDLYTIFYDEQLKALTNARSVTGRLFTEQEHADHHCQVGNLPLLLETITDWTEERSNA